MMGLDEIALENKRASLPPSEDVLVFVERAIKDFIEKDPPICAFDRGFLEALYWVLVEGFDIYDEELGEKVHDVLAKSRREYPR